MKNLAIFIGIIILLTGCTADVINISDCVSNDPAGFWQGLWHGFIAPFTFILSLFADEITMYAVHNTGGWYDFGFVLGAGILSRSV